tara:strand:+ start:117 stop:308 length:192 start_codon:yes stop_codon:yes gene_type:complete
MTWEDAILEALADKPIDLRTLHKRVQKTKGGWALDADKALAALRVQGRVVRFERERVGFWRLP